MLKNYFIVDGYTHRNIEPQATDPTNKKVNSEKFQKEVYQKAREILEFNRYRSVLDIGTGSGYKLVKYFNDVDSLGCDVPHVVEWLKKTYPDQQWSDDFSPRIGYDLIICADVIEHIVDPDRLLDMLEKCQPKKIVLSTPARNLGLNMAGPPNNPHHCREWTQKEFAEYIGSRFKITEHYISNQKQKTQLIVAQNK